MLMRRYGACVAGLRGRRRGGGGGGARGGAKGGGKMKQRLCCFVFISLFCSFVHVNASVYAHACVY